MTKSVNSHKSMIETQVDISEYQTEYCIYFSRIVWVDPGAISELPFRWNKNNHMVLFTLS